MPTALITGASSGIGRALALELSREYTVYAAARRKELLDAMASPTLLPLVLDVADLDRTVAAIKALGPLDLVIANAGASPAHDADPYAWETLRDPCHVNFTGAVATLTAALPAMLQARRGHLVGISSLASFAPLPHAAAYTAPKAGLSAFLACLRMDLRSTGVAVTTVRPGFVATPHVAGSQHPLPQLVGVDAAARLIARRLKQRPAYIDFPQPFAFATRLFALLPDRLRFLLLSKSI